MAPELSDDELFRLLNFSAKALGASEEEVYEFTRCIRPDGSSFGTSGKCVPPNKTAPRKSKLEKEAEAEEKAALLLILGGRRHSRAARQRAKELLHSSARKKRQAQRP
jgi:hypothetical protein